MRTTLARLKLSLILTIAVFLPLLWVLALSTSPFLSSMGLTKLLFLGFMFSFVTAYAITLFISALRQSDN